MKACSHSFRGDRRPGCFLRARKASAYIERELRSYGYEPGSQTYPIGFHPGYPDRGNFLEFVADLKSALLLRSALKAFRSATKLPGERVVAPSSIAGIGWSDHWSFWQFGYKAVMLTDTAPYRYPYYHTAQDTPDKLDWKRFGQTVDGIQVIVRSLAAFGRD